MYRQTDGVAMGSPIGPVLANIFVGFQEQKLALEDNTDVLLYRRFVDDTFALNTSMEQSEKLLSTLNKLHPALVSTSKTESYHFWTTCSSGALRFTSEFLLKLQFTASQHTPGNTPDGTLSHLVNTKSILWGAWPTGQQEFARPGGWMTSWTASVRSSPTTVTHHTLSTGPSGTHWILAHAPRTQTRTCTSSTWSYHGLVITGQRRLKSSLFKPQSLLTQLATREFVLFPSLLFHLASRVPSLSMINLTLSTTLSAGAEAGI